MPRIGKIQRRTSNHVPQCRFQTRSWHVFVAIWFRFRFVKNILSQKQIKANALLIICTSILYCRLLNDYCGVGVAFRSQEVWKLKSSTTSSTRQGGNCRAPSPSPWKSAINSGSPASEKTSTTGMDTSWFFQVPCSMPRIKHVPFPGKQYLFLRMAPCHLPAHQWHGVYVPSQEQVPMRVTNEAFSGRCGENVYGKSLVSKTVGFQVFMMFAFCIL